MQPLLRSAQIPPNTSRERLDLLVRINQYNEANPRTKIYLDHVTSSEVGLVKVAAQEQEELKKVHEKCYVQRHATRAKNRIDSMLKLRDAATEEFDWDEAVQIFQQLINSTISWKAWLDDAAVTRRANEKAACDEVERVEKEKARKEADAKKLRDQQKAEAERQQRGRDAAAKKVRGEKAAEEKKKEKAAKQANDARDKQKDNDGGKVKKAQSPAPRARSDRINNGKEDNQYTGGPSNQSDSSWQTPQRRYPRGDPRYVSPEKKPTPQNPRLRDQAPRRESTTDLPDPHARPVHIRKATPKPQGIRKRSESEAPLQTHTPDMVAGGQRGREAESIVGRSKLTPAEKRARDLHSEVKKFTKI